MVRRDRPPLGWGPVRQVAVGLTPSVKRFHHPAEFGASGRPVAVAIGVFDGVHRGHQQVIRRLVEEGQRSGATTLVVTFDRHPNALVAPERTPPLIQSLGQRLRAIADLGPEAAWIIRFDRAFSQQPGEAFVRALARDFRPLASVFVGDRFHFGYRRSGNVALLERVGAELGFRTHAIQGVAAEGQVISSTRIREAIRAGDLDDAAGLLGRRYALAGTVIAGRRLGRELGFPTANLAVEGLVLPPGGVYAAVATWTGRRQPAVVNVGTRPTVDAHSLALHVEAHLLDFSGDLYGEELELAFVQRLRDERQFAEISALQTQIAADLRRAREVLAGSG